MLQDLKTIVLIFLRPSAILHNICFVYSYIKKKHSRAQCGVDTIQAWFKMPWLVKVMSSLKRKENPKVMMASKFTPKGHSSH